MCMEDIKLGRALNSEVRQINVTNAAAILVAQPDQDRTRIMISSDGANGIAVCPNQALAGIGVGFVLSAGTPFQVFRVEDWGSLIWQGWYARSLGANVTIAVGTSTLEKR